jgi:predicted transcriptional regulator
MIVESDLAKHQILKTLSYRTSSWIIIATQETPQTVMELSRLHDLTPKQVSDSIRTLVDIGMIAPIKSPGSADGHAYRSTLRRVNVSVGSHGLVMDVELNLDLPRRSLERFVSLARTPALECS